MRQLRSNDWLFVMTSQISNLVGSRSEGWRGQSQKLSAKQKNGLVIVYYGNGKGKTTTAVGLAIRAAGRGLKTKIIQFIKGPVESGEEIWLKSNLQIEIEKFGLGFVGILGDKRKISEHQRTAQIALAQAASDLKDKKYDILILDEILGAIKGNLIPLQSVLKLIKEKPPAKTLVLTGAPKIDEIIKCSDLVSEIKKIKHPFDKGIQAIKGIDY